MRSADIATLARTAMIFLIAYLVVIKFYPIATILIFAIALAVDGVDGYLAVNESSMGAIGVTEYIKSSLGNEKYKKKVKEAKLKTSKLAPYAPRFDVAADRIAEYSMWVLFLYLHIVPLFVLFIIIARHSIVDSLMGVKGTSSKMKRPIARALYSSNASRALANILKFVTFSYLVLQYVWSYPVLIGNVLVGVLVAFIVLRGISEALENIG